MEAKDTCTALPKESIKFDKSRELAGLIEVKHCEGLSEGHFVDHQTAEREIETGRNDALKVVGHIHETKA